MCFKVKPNISVIGGVTAERLRYLSPCSVYLFDSTYYYPEPDDWTRIFIDILSNLPPYMEDRFDCDDCSLLVKARSAERYKINAIGIVIGNSPYGYHAWNAYISDGLLFYLEPQTGEIWQKDSNYQPDLIIW